MKEPAMAHDRMEQALGRLEEAQWDFMALLTVAASFGPGHEDAEVALYRAWMEKLPDHPLMAAALFNCGTVLQRAGDRARATDCFQRAIGLKPDFIPPYINLGTVLEQGGDRLGAVATWRSAIDRLASVSRDALDHKLMALNQSARVLASADLDEVAEEALTQSLALDPTQDEIVRHWINFRQRRFQWPMLASLPAARHRSILERIAPLTLASWSDDPLWQLGNAAEFTRREIGRPALPAPRPHPRGAPDKRLRIGYLSADLWEHAVGFLTAELFGLHDRAKVEVHVYFNGEPKSDRINARIRDGVDVWRDIRTLGDDAAAALIAADEIDILVDLSGHTKDARTALLARLPAPIIVNWLGYPGTMGTLFHHYIIADPFIIPDGSEIYYSERVVRLPCYQPTDRRRLVSDAPQSRAQAGLPAAATVYCCFNEPRKITEDTWRRWMAILRAVPDSVLWLLIPAQTTQARLREMAAQEGLSPDRLVFAPRHLNPDHLARYVLADLVLDSFPYGAHTTASDALWMGVPVLTLAGRSFASRVCGSLVRAAGLPELVCETEADYVAKAVELGRDAAKRQVLSRRLREHRDTCLLFDMPGLVSALESLYRGMWEAWLRGEHPRPDLANMALYRDIGIDIALDPPAGADYHHDYRRRVAACRLYTPIVPDQRLCQDEQTRGDSL
jgi:predicted O-linked N-acetylglucosamine transferase (SPINDLY family)